MKRLIYTALAVIGMTAAAIAVVNPVTAADHLEAPRVQGDGQVDINDLYAFQSPENPDNTVLIMTVNPAAGFFSPETFSRTINYRIRVDKNGDARRDDYIQFRFGRAEADGSQRVSIYGPGGRRASGFTGETIEFEGGGRATAGLFEDPFFFDFLAFQGAAKGMGDRAFCDAETGDFFAGLNVSGMVIELPSSWLTGDTSNIGVWGETYNGSTKVDRIGRPAIATVLIDDGSENRFNRGRAVNDPARFGDQVVANRMAFGHDQASAEGLADVLLPDILTFDTANPNGFLNGRQLANDVIDVELDLITVGGLTTDCVDSNDVEFPGVFPYLATAHEN